MDERFKAMAERLADRLSSTKAIINFVGMEMDWVDNFLVRKRNFYFRGKSGLSIAEKLRRAGILIPKERGGYTAYRSEIRLYLGTGRRLVPDRETPRRVDASALPPDSVES